MKNRILNFGVSATHDSTTTLANLGDFLSISEFDALVFDPDALVRVGLNLESFHRKQSEIRDLLGRKGGVVVCLLRPAAQLGFAYGGRNADTYGILDAVAFDGLVPIRTSLRAGQGLHVKALGGAKGASAAYLRVLDGALRFTAYLDTDPANLKGRGWTVLSVDSVGHPIAVELEVGAGRICLVPAPEGATGDRVGSAIARLVEAHYGGPSQIDAPPWPIEVAVPGATTHDATISTLQEKKKQIEAEIEQLSDRKNDLLNYRVLLYGYGKSLLEPVVRRAFRLLGFDVPEPDQYKGEWDVELHQPGSSVTAIGEVEGSEGVVNVDKYRQLLDYIQAEVLEGRDHKGILIGNGYRLAPLDAAERQRQFSDHALRGAKKNQFCLLPTVELFKAVCAVLESSDNEGLKIGIRDSVLSCVDVWAFSREVHPQPARLQPQPGQLV